MNFETQYVSLIEDIKAMGHTRQTRNAIAKSIFGYQLTTNELTYGVFPMLKGRQLFWEGVVGELAAFLNGPERIEDFTSRGCNYWKAWAHEDGKIEVDYGNKWSNFHGVDQLVEVVESLKNDPYGRRHLITGWDPSNLDNVDLPCCHYAYQWYVNEYGYLDMIWIQRSVDTVLGLPSDMILAAVWNLLMAQTTGYKPGRITMQLGDTHIYEEHLSTLDSYLVGAQLQANKPQPGYWLSPAATVFNFEPEMFAVQDYEHGPKLAFPLIK